MNDETPRRTRAEAMQGNNNARGHGLFSTVSPPSLDQLDALVRQAITIHNMGMLRLLRRAYRFHHRRDRATHLRRLYALLREGRTFDPARWPCEITPGDVAWSDLHDEWRPAPDGESHAPVPLPSSLRRGNDLPHRSLFDAAREGQDDAGSEQGEALPPTDVAGHAAPFITELKAFNDRLREEERRAADRGRGHR